jgi:hypothetical protein
MFEKQGKFYADWRDRKGVRKRKSFKSAHAALQFEEEQKVLAHPKTTAHGRRLPMSCAPNIRASQTPTSTSQPKRSSLKLVHSRRTSSARRTSPTLTKKSTPATTRTPQNR